MGCGKSSLKLNTEILSEAAVHGDLCFVSIGSF